ncbi:hypothetical protein BS50DRAFT_629920 [Corynespora cassiicola Philippines]|uniref:Uncharacterized protein n=1 Tax=Corynespora cassiicola Philippines TaxID=1448308 RepID=A0A2T2P296_CORCC|nr:hypothetical protein BS50DRAFT_629920 [Corynespora cassiicola Philippines]
MSDVVGWSAAYSTRTYWTHSGKASIYKHRHSGRRRTLNLRLFRLPMESITILRYSGGICTTYIDEEGASGRDEDRVFAKDLCGAGRWHHVQRTFDTPDFGKRWHSSGDRSDLGYGVLDVAVGVAWRVESWGRFTGSKLKSQLQVPGRRKL